MTVHVLNQLSLWVEGDLSASEMTAIDGHLAGCPACREAAEDLRASQAWLRDAMAAPFNASDHERLQQRVMGQIRNEVSPPLVRRFIFRRPLLAATAAALLLVTLTWTHRRPLEATPKPLPWVPGAGTGTMLPPDPAPPPTRQASTHPTPPRPQARPTTPNPPEIPARIEFQTADPTIRIIWLAQTTPLPEPTPIFEEKS